MENIFQTPVIQDFSENALRIRRNLMLVGALCIFYKFNNLELTEAGNFLGISFKSLPSVEAIDIALFLLVAYHLVHFTWISFEKIIYLALRVTSPQNGEQPLFDDPQTIDPTQSTFYFWWSMQRDSFVAFNTNELLEALKSTNLEYERLLPSYGPGPTINELGNQIYANKSKIDMVANNLRIIKELIETLSTGQAEKSLCRFDRWFSLYQTGQLLRWAIIEIELPIILGVAAICYTWPF